ncbi:MAG TPA: PhoU domain-containing protein [Pyrinomonadaceae bacterium]|nr:PhoU domain-containing protein [Pyrinomonadaceae bacterium]
MGENKPQTDTQLDLLRDGVLLLGRETDDTVHRAMRKIIERDSDLADSICEDDPTIDQIELEIDRLSIEILGLRRPTEHDLRLVVSVAKITPIHGRIAARGSSIA